MATLDKACTLHPQAKWWIKGDGCDLVSSFEKSLRQEWNGDVDLGNGELQQLYRTYQDRLKMIENLTMNVFVGEKKQDIVKTLKEEEETLRGDIVFITHGMFYACECHIDVSFYSIGRGKL